jgi:hypothetical protein
MRLTLSRDSGLDWLGKLHKGGRLGKNVVVCPPYCHAYSASASPIQMLDCMAYGAVASGQLEDVLARFRPIAMPIALVFPTIRRVSLRLRLLIEALSDKTRVAAPRARTPFE